MKKVLVLGATGSMGIHLTFELANRGFEVVAFARDLEKLNRYFQSYSNITVHSGDAFLLEDLLQAAQGIDVIFHAINIPYPEWKDKLHILMENIIEAAKQHHCKIAYVDNIYAYGESPGHPIQETHPKIPHTRKGNLRLELEGKLHDAHAKGIPALIIHFPDFYGPHAGNTLLNTTLQPLAAGKRSIFVGNPKIKREYIFLPDAAKALVELSLQENSYGQHWNIPGAGVITGEEILSLCEQVLNRKCSFMSVGKKMMFLAGLFNPFMYEVREMLYLTENPVVLDGSKFFREIGSFYSTPYEEGIRLTLQSLMEA